MGVWNTPSVLLSGCGGQRGVALPLGYEAPSGLLKTESWIDGEGMSNLSAQPKLLES